MQAIMYIELNAFALAVMLLIFLNIRNKLENCLFELRLFLALLGANAFILILDTIIWAIDGQPGGFARNINLVITALYYILNPAVSIIWLFYVDYQIYKDKSHMKKILLPVLISTSINAVFAILSMFGNYTFYIDQNNVYHRGKLFWVMALISYSYLVYNFVLIIIKRNSIRKKYFNSIIMFIFPPLLCALIQGLFYGLSLMWSGMTISILNIYITIQDDQLYVDHLTGLCNRRHLDSYLQNKSKNNTNKHLLGGIMIDVNCFKQINDSYGHSAGDKALEYTSQILKKSLRQEDFIARYGGDEFVIILEIYNRLDLINSVNNINKNIEDFNSQKSVPYEISLSIGFDTFDCKSEISTDEFLKHIDQLMYEDKKIKKELDDLKK